MTGIAERVKGFVESWRLTHCAICQALLHDGKFIMIDKKLYCLGCHDRRPNESNDIESTEQKNS